MITGEDRLGSIRVHGQTYEAVAVAPSPMMAGWVRVTFVLEDGDRTYHIPPHRVEWFIEGAKSGPLT